MFPVFGQDISRFRNKYPFIGSLHMQCWDEIQLLTHMINLSILFDLEVFGLVAQSAYFEKNMEENDNLIIRIYIFVYIYRIRPLDTTDKTRPIIGQNIQK